MRSSSLLGVLLGLAVSLAVPVPDLTAAEYHFVARIPSGSDPIWTPDSQVIDLGRHVNEEIVLVLDNPTDVPHGFAIPGLQAVSREKRLTPASNPFLPKETSLQYTVPLWVTVEPHSTTRVRISDSGIRAKPYYAETFPVLCPEHRGMKAGTLEIVR